MSNKLFSVEIYMIGQEHLFKVRDRKGDLAVFSGFTTAEEAQYVAELTVAQLETDLIGDSE